METSHEKQSYEYSKSGLTVSVSSPAIDTIQSISNKVDRASEVGDKRLAALYDVQAAQALSGLDKKINNTVNGISEKDDKGKDGKKVSDISLNVSLGTTSKTQNSTNDTTQAKGSQISAGKNLDIIATGTNKDDGNVTIQGSTVTGDKVHIQAVKDVTIESAENQTSNNTQTDGKSSGIGAQISAKGVGFYAEGSKNKELENGTILTHTPSVVTAKDTLKIEAGHDVNILGSKASGDRVEVNVGNDLNLASQQDIDNYNEKSSSSGGKIGTAGIGLQGNASKGKIDSNYESVTTQAEIHAGQGGFNIEVGKNTDLKGAVISSDATPDKNKISTDTLTYSDIQNKADYSASSTGGTFGIKQVKKPEQDSKGELTFKDQTIVTKSIDQGIPVKGSASTTTSSAIANGTIEVRSNPGQNLAGLNRETEKSLNALGKIFDKKKVQEKQELVNLFSQEANQLIGDLSLKKYQETLKKAEAEKETPAYAGLLEEANKWKDGGINKILLHTAVGGITSGLSGDGFKTGAVSAGLNETLQKELSKINDPVLHQLASSIIGFVAAKAVSGDTQTAGAINASATKNNFLNHYQQERFAQLLAGAKSKAEKAQIVAYYTALSLYNIQNKLLGGDHDDEVVEPDLLDELHHLDANIPGLNYALNDLTINMLTEYDAYNLANYYREKLNQTNGMYEYPVENFYGLDQTVVYTGPLTGVDTTPDPDVQKANELIAANGEIVVGEDGKKVSVN